MDSRALTSLTPMPTSQRPLLGVTILLVEDSIFACETMRIMCLRSGARLRRADCLHSARRHLQVYRPSAVIVDMGLPDGCGAELIEELAYAHPRVGIILGCSGDDVTRDIAIAAGADGFIMKPVPSIATFQQAILSHLPADRQPACPRIVPDYKIEPDNHAYRDDMAHAAELLRGEPHRDELAYTLQFLNGVARCAADDALVEASQHLSSKLAHGGASPAELGHISALVSERMVHHAVT